MKLAEAIKQLSTLPLASHDFEIEKDKNAIKLGIEALKRVADQRNYFNARVHGPLPGETEE